MKNYSICIILFAACILFGGCVSSQNSVPERGRGLSAAEFTPVVMKNVIPFDRKDSESARFEMSLALFEPANSGPGIGNLIRELLYEGQSAVNYGKTIAVEHEKPYAKLRPEWIPQGGARMDSFNWYYMERIESRTVPVKNLIPGRENLLVLTKTTESYLGGAHGNTSTVCFVIDPVAVKQLTLDDIFGSREELRRLLEAELRRQYQLPEGAPLSEAGFFEDSIELPENFFPAEEAPGDASGGSPKDSLSMHFLWNIYEIAPYVMGTIEVSLPLEELSRFFRE
jgi:hypothetical protein